MSNSFDLATEFVFVISTGAILYHHVGYPLLLRLLAKSRDMAAASKLRTMTKDGKLPSIRMIVPAHNEESVIAEKIANFDALDYPRDLLKVRIALDGCTDETQATAIAAISKLHSDLDIGLSEYKENIGKVAVLNDQISQSSEDIVALTDASALLPADVLTKAATHFADRNIGVVCPSYRLSEAGSDGERVYWDYQTRIKHYEALLAAPMGAHGALYFFRRKLWAPLPPDTINDDFILPMRIVEQGYRAIYDHSTYATELETTSDRQEFHRRLRIGAGNMQQALRLKSFANPRRGWLAFLFLSGKGLRPMVPFLAILALAASVFGAAQGAGVFDVILSLELMLIATVLFATSQPATAMPKPLAWLRYMSEGHIVSFLGAVSYLANRQQTTWGSARQGGGALFADDSFIPWVVRASKRVLDVILALGALIALIILYVPIALAIKLDTRGPVLYRQTRVGRSTATTTNLFSLLKFRTMVVDAESATGPVWASKTDPRVSRVGRFLRKTRLDELPQCINVLKGEMSVVGPRPERPHFVRKFENAIPFYTDRTFGLLPGITGLAQVNQQYDSSIEDVRSKMIYDHAYAVRLSDWWSWLKTDVGIILKTIFTMIWAKGQ